MDVLYFNTILFREAADIGELTFVSFDLNSCFIWLTSLKVPDHPFSTHTKRNRHCSPTRPLQVRHGDEPASPIATMPNDVILHQTFELELCVFERTKQSTDTNIVWRDLRKYVSDVQDLTRNNGWGLASTNHASVTMSGLDLSLQLSRPVAPW